MEPSARSPLACRCVGCGIVEIAAPGQEPVPVGCEGGRPHEWVRAEAYAVAEFLAQELAGYTVTVFRDAAARMRRATGYRIDDPQGNPFGRVLVTNDFCDVTPPQAVPAWLRAFGVVGEMRRVAMVATVVVGLHGLEG